MNGIGKEEQFRRRNNMDSVLGTHAMEGLFPDEATLAFIERYVTGEFTMEEWSSAMERHAHSLLPSDQARSLPVG